MYIIINTDISAYNQDESEIQKFWLTNNIINACNVTKRSDRIIPKRIHINSYELYDEYNNNPITLSTEKKINKNLTCINSVENNDDKNDVRKKDNKSISYYRIPCKKIQCSY
jgi:hypothetical protein